MKDIFVINESERERILKMHVERTQKHYLKEDYEINENAKETGEYKIQSNVYFLENSNKLFPELKLFKGATFKKTPGQERLVANTTYQYVDTLTGQVVKGANNASTVSRDNERDYTFKGTITYLCQSGKFVTDKSKNQYFDEQGELVKRLKLACAFKGQGTQPQAKQPATETQPQAKQPATGTQKPGGATSSKINTPSDADLDNILQQLG